VSGAAHLLAEPPFAVAALEGLLAGVLQEAAGREREAEQAGSESREPRVEGPGNAVTCLYPHIRGLTTPPAPPPPPAQTERRGSMLVQWGFVGATLSPARRFGACVPGFLLFAAASSSLAPSSSSRAEAHEPKPKEHLLGAW
jgi:hypothetical protein